MTARPVGALAEKVLRDAVSHDLALRDKWRVPEALHLHMVDAIRDVQALIAERDAEKQRHADNAAKWLAERDALRAQAAALAGALEHAMRVHIDLRSYSDAVDALSAYRAGGGK